MMRYRKQEKIEKIKSNLLDNFSYKLVALFISLILWLSILNRRDYVVTKDLEIDFITAQNLVVAAQSSAGLKVKVSGPQPLLKKYKEAPQVLALDLSDKKAGFYELEMNASRVEIPKGLRVLGLRPNTVRVELIESSTAAFGGEQQKKTESLNSDHNKNR